MTYLINESVCDLPKDWDSLNNNIFLTTDFLIAQETSPPIGMKFFYISFYLNNKFVGKTALQWTDLSLGKTNLNQNKYLKPFLKLINQRVLTVGNVLLTGQNAFEKSPEIDIIEIVIATEKAIEEILKLLKTQNKTPHHIIYKDFYEVFVNEVQKGLPKHYQRLTVEPNMLVPIRSEWKTFDDYLNSMKSKYRTRAKSVFKKSETILFRELDKQEVIHHNQKIHSLYREVVDALDFVAYYLPNDYFKNNKTILKDKFKVFGAFLNNELIAFHTLIPNKDFLESGFIGFKQSLQQDHQLYNTMLYKMIEYSINHQFKTLVLSRSAIEIKSTVGAIAKQTYGLARLNQPIFQYLSKPIYSRVYTPQNFILRNPFK